MKKIKIITDSCSDLSKELRENYDIDYVAMDIHYDGVDKKASLDWDLYSPKEFYDIMRNGTRVTTSQVPVQAFVDIFNKYLDLDFDIIYIACSSALSGSCNTAVVVANKIMDKNPSAKIAVVDSLNSCMGEGLLALMAARMNQENKSFSEIVSFLEANKLRINQFCTTDSLKYLKWAGRVKASAAFFGNIIGIKPIIISDAKGNNFAHKKVKGKSTSYLEIVNEAKEAIEDISNSTVYIVHSDALDDAMKLKQLVQENINPKDIQIGMIGPIIGASVGPGAVAIYVFGKEVTVIGE